MPTSPAAGARVVFNGTISAGNVIISANGTSANPVWFMGYNTSSRPTWTGIDNGAEGYIIFDNINFNGSGQRGGFNTGDNVFVRNCNFQNSYASANYATAVVGGVNATFYGCVFGPVGNWAYTGTSDLDCHGIKVTAGTDYLWIVDNTFYHCQGDGVQCGESSYSRTSINHVYMGRNTGYENLQSCLWVKTGIDVIISENTCYNIDVHDSSESCVGQAFGAQYDPGYVWFLANKMYNTWAGIHIAGASAGTGGPFYAIGNLAYDIDSGFDCDAYNAGAFGYRNAGGAYFFFNTAYNCEVFYTGVNGSATVRNNIFSQKTGSCSAYTLSGQSVTHDYNLYSSSAYDPGSESNRKIEAATDTFISAGTNFALKSTSLARDNAITTEETAFATFQSRYGIDIRKDILGASRPASATDWDIGAYEYGEGSDTTAPSVSITTSDPSTITSDSLTVTGTASDAVGVSSCKYRLGSAPDGSNGTACTGTTSWSCSTSGYSVGANTLYIGCGDAAGNWGSDSITVNFTPVPISGINTSFKNCIIHP